MSLDKFKHDLSLLKYKLSFSSGLEVIGIGSIAPFIPLFVSIANICIAVSLFALLYYNSSTVMLIQSVSYEDVILKNFTV